VGFCGCGPRWDLLLRLGTAAPWWLQPLTPFSLHTLDFIRMAITSTAATHSTPVVRRSSTSRPLSTLQLLRESLSQTADGAQASPSPATPNGDGALGSLAGFTTRQIAALSAPLDRANVRQRE